jgi:protein-S-isoprenylcysteine O-methyltransferase Ste14
MNKNKFYGNLCVLFTVSAMIVGVVGVSHSIAIQSYAYFVGTGIVVALIIVASIAFDAMVKDSE